MDAVKITDLFKGNQLEEIRYWLDWETPANNDDTWINTNPGEWTKMCAELTTLHLFTIDKARDVFGVHNLLPTFSTIKWYENEGFDYKKHFDSDPVEYTIVYNFYSEKVWDIEYNGFKYNLENEEALAYCGSQFEHSRLQNPGGLTIALYLNYATPDNYHFIFGEYSSGEPTFKSGRNINEIEKDWN